MSHDSSDFFSPSEGGSPGLAALFALASAEDFLNGSWPGTPRVFHHEEGSAPEVFQLPDLQSLAGVLSIAAPGTVFANLPDRDEEYNQIQIVDPADAQKAYACRMGISLEPDLAKLPELIFWLRGIHRDLGLAKETFARCNIYAIPGNGRTAAHYDQNINFVCQVVGEKVWELAPNASIVNPSMRHTAGTAPDRATAAEAKAALPKEMPAEGRIRVVLKPGSVLFVPRGYWHQTSSAADSIALNFTYEQVSWARALASAISEHLSKEEEWRGVAYGLQTDGALSEKAQAEFTALLRKIGWKIGDLGFKDLS